MNRNKTLVVATAFIICILTLSILLKPQSIQENEANCSKCPPCEYPSNQSTGLKLIYLMPDPCIDCNPEIIDKISRQLGIEIQKYYSDSVPQPSLLIFKDDVSTLATATRRYNILDSICEFANHTKACELREYINTTRTVNCLAKYNISRDTVIYLHNKESPECRKIRGWVTELEETHSVYTISLTNPERMSIGRECLTDLTSFKNIFVPQLICPADGRIHVGSLSKQELIDFTADCRNRGG